MKDKHKKEMQQEQSQNCELERENQSCDCEECACDDCQCDNCDSENQSCQCENCQGGHDCENCEPDECDCDCDCQEDCQCEQGATDESQREAEMTEENPDFDQPAEEDAKKEEDSAKQDRLSEIENKAQEYLKLAMQTKADFENYRRHAQEDIKDAKTAGQVSVIEAFLPCLDTFKEAKKSISDQTILDGINMIEEKIVGALQDLGVEKIPSVGEVYNPHLHEGIAYMKDENQENDIILNEYQAGYTFKGKVIRYSKVIVNKL